MAAESSLTLAKAELIGLVLHSFLYGLYNVLFAQSIRWPWQAPDRRPRNHLLMFITCALWVLITAHWGVQISRADHAFIQTVGKPSAIPDAATAFYGQASDPLNLVKEVLYLSQSVLGDFTMVYRTWVVWNRNYYVAALPALILCGFITSAIAVCVAIAELKPGQGVFESSVGVWALCVFSTTVALNVITTSLIITRVWSIKRTVTSGGKRGGVMGGVLGVVHIIIESAALYTLTALLTLVGYQTEQTWQFITIDVISPIIGIAFTLITVRVNNAAQQSASQPGNTSELSHARYPTRRQYGSPIAVNVSRHVATDALGDKDSADQDYKSFSPV